MGNWVDAFRFLTFRGPKNPDAVLSPLAVLAIFLTSALFDCVVERVAAGPDARFYLYGINALIAGGAVSLTVNVFFARGQKTGETFRLLALLSAAVSMFCSAAWLFCFAGGESRLAAYCATILVSWAATIFGAGRAFKLAGSRRPIWRAIGYTVCFWLVGAALPAWPVFAGPEFKPSQANLWEAFADALRQNQVAEEKAD